MKKLLHVGHQKLKDIRAAHGDISFSLVFILIAILFGFMLVGGLYLPKNAQRELALGPTSTPFPTLSLQPTTTAVPPTPTSQPTIPPTNPPSATPTRIPSATPTTIPPTLPITPITTTGGIFIARERLRQLPMSGAAWAKMKSVADGNLGTADLSNQDSMHDVNTLAAALVYGRTGIDSYRLKAMNAIMSAIGTEGGARALATGRNIAAYVIAADIIDLKTYNPAKDQQLKTWLRNVIRQQTTQCDSIILCHERRPNNWGTHAGASRIAVDMYVGDSADLNRAAQVFNGWLGDRSAYSGFSYNAPMTWHCNESAPVGINPAGCTKSGHSIDGVLPDDQRRGGGFTWPPPKENYVYGGLSGALIQAQLLSRAGYDSWNWSNQALKRSFVWLHTQANFPAVGNDTWETHLVNSVYGTSFPAPIPSTPGTSMGWTDWMFAK